MADLSLASQTMFAELLQRCLDAEFDALYNDLAPYVPSRRAKSRLGIVRKQDGFGRIDAGARVADTWSLLACD